MNKGGKKLDKYCLISSGGTPRKNNLSFYTSGSILWATIADMEKSDGIVLDTKLKITEKGLSSIGNRLFPKDTLFLAMYGSVGKVAIAGQKMAVNQAILGINAKNNNEICMIYLKYWLMHNKPKIINKARGGILKNLSAKIVKNLKIELAPYSEQIKIANLLSQVEGLIAKREESINLLDELLKSTFLDMFGDPVLNGKGWDTKLLKKFGKISTGNTPPRKELAYYMPEYIEWIKTDNINRNKIYLTKAKEYLSEKGLEKGRFVKENSLLVTCIAGSVKSIGNASVANRTVAFNQQINAIEPNEDIDINFLYWMFRISKKYVQDQAGKGMKKMISKSTFEKITFPYPPKPLQNKFATIVQQVEESKEKYQNSLDELRDLFGSLLQRAFRGELELEDTKKVLALDLKVGLDSSVANTLAVASKIKGLGVKLPKLGIDTSSLSIGSKVADSIAKLDTLSKITSASKIRDLGVKLPKVGIDISSINSLSKVMGSSLVGNEYSSLHDKLSSLSTVNMTDMLSTSSRALRDSFMTTEQLSQNLLGHTFELDKYTKGLSSTYFDTWRKEEENRISELISKHTLGFSSQELWTNKISETFNKTALDNLESAYGITKLSSNIWEEENARLDAIKVKFSDDWQTEQEKFQELVGLGKYDESILSFKKEHESLFDLPVTATSFDTNIIDGTKYLEEMHSTIDNLGLDAINKAFEVSQPYKIALEQAEAMKSLYGWGEPYETLIDKYSEQVEETKEIIESISNLSELIHDELFENLMWNESYDNIKALVYKLIDEGKLEQVFDEDKDNSKLLLKKVEK